ncbi:MAG: TonB C-terminal domain-containing protein [Acidobacteriota bacterium]|jgi:outer membrane biosynthesis protein TonB
MARERRERYGNERITLRQTLIIAVMLHLILGGVVQWKPDLLWSEPIQPTPESRPIEFRFVDVPPTPTDETPDTEVMSDVDRVAADQSERDDAVDPFSEGNTPQEVLRSEPDTVEVPTPETQPAVTPEPVAAAEPETQPTNADPAEASASETPVAETPPAEETVAQPEAATAAVQPLANSAPVLPPPRNRTLRDSLVRGMEQFVEPEVFANPDGGADGSQGLVSFDTKGYDLGAYINQVLRIIERNWKGNIPPAARWQGQEGAVFTNISIVRNPDRGDQALLVVTRSWSSGKPAFDQAALIALEISSPLPPLPNFFPFDQLDGRLGFLYNLDPSQVTFPRQQ